MRLATHNAAPYARKDWVIWGSPTINEHSISNLSDYSVGLLKVPARFTGEVEVEPPPAGPFTLHPAVREQMLSGGFKPWVEINGRVIDLEPTKDLLVNDPRVIVSQWKDRMIDATAKLFIYLFTDSPILHFELGVFGESLASPNQPLVVRFMLGTGPKAVTFIYDNDRLDNNGNPLPSVADPIKLLRTPLRTGDAQGHIYRGIVAFYRGDETQEERESTIAAMHHPLMGMDNWTDWGAWNKVATTIGNPLDESGQLASVNWRDPLAHPKFLNNARPADSGEQAEFAVPWTHYADVSHKTAVNLWRKLCAAYRESCRPIHYYDHKADPIKAADHPQLVMWSEQPHWSRVASPDQLGRTHAGSDASGWFGHDDQHQGWIFALENHRLTGSFMLKHMIEAVQENWTASMTLPSTHPNHAGTNDPGPGRAVGHVARAVSLSLNVNWNEKLFDQFCRRIEECIYPSWQRQQKTGPISPYTIIGPDPRTGFPNQASWAPWQDSVFVMGMDCFLRLHFNMISTATKNKILTMIEAVGRSVCEYGYTPDGAEAVAYMPIPGGNPPSNYNDPLQCTKAVGTDWRHWGLTCIGIIEQRTGLPRATQLRERHQGTARAQFTGTLLP